jgi:hypothetical protein
MSTQQQSQGRLLGSTSSLIRSLASQHIPVFSHGSTSHCPHLVLPCKQNSEHLSPARYSRQNAFHSSPFFCMSETHSLSVASLWRLVFPAARRWLLPYRGGCGTTACCHSQLLGYVKFGVVMTSLGVRLPLLLLLVQKPQN